MKKKWMYVAAPTAMCLAPAATALANSWCGMLGYCNTFVCVALSLAGCIGGYVDGSLM